MILDSISKLETYVSCHSQFADAVTFLNKTNLQELPNGKHAINEKGAFVSVSEYETKDEKDCYVECHQKHIDIQIITKGEESIGYCMVDTCTSQPYDAEKDVQKLEGKVSYFTITPRQFAIFFPHDGHKPCIRVDNKATTVKKIVFKIPVE